MENVNSMPASHSREWQLAKQAPTQPFVQLLTFSSDSGLAAYLHSREWRYAAEGFACGVDLTALKCSDFSENLKGDSKLLENPVYVVIFSVETTQDTKLKNSPHKPIFNRWKSSWYFPSVTPNNWER